MRQETIIILRINELTDKAREKAYKNYHESLVWAAIEHQNQESLDEFWAIFPITINQMTYGSCSIDVQFEMDTNYEEIEKMSGLRLSKYLYNNYWKLITKSRCYKKLVSTFKDGTPIPVSETHPYKLRCVERHSNCQVQTFRTLAGYPMDDVLLGPIFKFMNQPDGTTFKELMKKCLKAWIDACYKARQRKESMEYFVEMAEVDGWEFLENGARWEYIPFL